MRTLAGALGRQRWLLYPLALGLGASLALAQLHVSMRLLLTVGASLAAGLAVFLWPSVTVVAIMAWLPILGLVRRMLIPVAGWSTNDPLLLIGPLIVLLYCAQHNVYRRPWNLLTSLMVIVLGICIVEALSPLGAGIRANMVGSLFITMPLLWYFVGRTVHRTAVEWILRALPFAAVPLLAYGMHQVFLGFLPWDQSWLDIAQSSYGALGLGTFIRPFGTFPSSAEYESFLLCATVVSFGMCFRTRGLLRLAYPVLGLAYWTGAFFAGSRTGMVTCVAAVGTLWAYRADAGRTLRLVMVAAAVLAGYLVFLHGHQYSVPTSAASSSAESVIVGHQLQGLSQPFNNKTSTLPGHLHMLLLGIGAGLHHPLGEGIGIITLAGSHFGSSSMSSEMDVTNMFVAGGVLGGMAYGVTFFAILVGAFRRRGAHSLAEYVLPGVLLVTFGQWLNGGYYFVSSLVWLLVGHVLGSVPVQSYITARQARTDHNAAHTAPQAEE